MITKTNNIARFAIIIPAYNAENYIDDCLNSLINQTYKNWTAIIVDDGSTDNTFFKLIEYSNNDSRFKIFKKENGGVASARNYALSKLNEIEYDWIHFLDIDDWIDPNRLYNINLLLNKYSDPLIDYIRSYSTIKADRTQDNILNPRLENDEVISNVTYFKRRQVGGYICSGIISSKLFETHQIMFLEDLHFLEDQVFLQKYAMRSNRILIYPRKDYYYYKPVRGKYNSYYQDIIKCIEVLWYDPYINQCSEFKDFYNNFWLKEKITLLVSYIPIFTKKKFDLPLDKKNLLRYCNSYYTKLKYLFLHLRKVL